MVNSEQRHIFVYQNGKTMTQTIATTYSNYIFEVLSKDGKLKTHSVTSDGLEQAKLDMEDLLDDGEIINEFLRCEPIAD